MSHYHDAHRPYLDAVAAALTAAGIDVADHDAHPDDPRGGFVELAVPVQAPIVLGWTEERGWWRGTEKPGGHGELWNLYDSPFDVLPSPAVVVTWVRTVVAGTADDLPVIGGGFYLRYQDDADDFEERLAEYGSGA